MADVHISDQILYELLARLPAKPLFRFRRVSKQWKFLIKDPYLMKLRSHRPTILLSHESIVANVHVEGTANPVVDLSSLLGDVTIVGTFNGIVLLLLDKGERHELILYNPFTRVSKMLPDPPYSYPDWLWVYAYGFGYGETMDDLIIVRFKAHNHYYQISDDCDVFRFKKSSWEKMKHPDIQDFQLLFRVTGKFLNGFLYWIGYTELDKLVIASLNVRDMLFSTITPPVQFSSESSPLGMIDGCLSIIVKSGDMGFNVWVMKEQGVESSWANTLSVRLEGYRLSNLYPACILDSGRIVIMDISLNQGVIYYTSNGSFKKLSLPEELKGFNSGIGDGIEYVESLVSPSDLCFV